MTSNVNISLNIVTKITETLWIDALIWWSAIKRSTNTAISWNHSNQVCGYIQWMFILWVSVLFDELQYVYQWACSLGHEGMNCQLGGSVGIWHMDNVNYTIIKHSTNGYGYSCAASRKLLHVLCNYWGHKYCRQTTMQQ